MKGAGILGPVVIGASLVLAAVAFALVGEVLRGAGDTGTEATVVRLTREVEAQAARIDALEAAVQDLRRGQDALGERLAAGGGGPATPVPVPVPVPDLGALPTLPADQFGGSAATLENEDLSEGMEISKGHFNQGVKRPTPALLRQLLGEPRQSYSDQCQPVTNPRLLAALETRQVGTFRVTMLRPALDSFQKVLARLRTEEPEIYASLGTAGALCARHVRGAPNAVSSHAWGAAVDLTLTGSLDQMGDDSTQFGLVVLAEFFNDAGWFWGAGFGREDSMHFEVGEALLRQWVADGRM